LCGICGIVGFADKKLIENMCDVIKHRGPDDSGIFIDRNIALGIRRLSIIDVRGGHQPIHNENETLWIIFNGEIYNFIDLREDLIKKGHRFYTETDTEVVLHLYEEEAEDCVKKLRGMFAFAIWDNVKRKLFLARDRFGKKPLYYTHINDKFFFASEIKSLLQYEEIERKIDQKALYYFLTFRYVPGPMTILQNILKLQPGHTLIYEKNCFKVKKYWDINFKPEIRTEEFYIKTLQKILEESIKMRLMSEVPLGAYLSGGTDSSTIVGIMSKFIDEPVKTFTVGFGDERFDETKVARIVSEKFSTDHHELVIKQDSVKHLPKIVWHFDEPVADPAAIPTYLLSEFAKKYVTVVITGEGGDELFAGYEHYKIISMTEKYLGNKQRFLHTLVPVFIKKIPKGFLNTFFPYSSALGEEGVKRFDDYIKSFGNLSKSYLSIVSIFNQSELNELYGKQYNVVELVEQYLNQPLSTIDRLLLVETKVQLPDNLLMKVDKMTMAFSIESRAPLLDHKLAEFVSTIPWDMKLHGQKSKYILKKVMAKFLPREITKRKKQRFFVPIDIWFNGELKDIVIQMFSESEVKKRHCFNYYYIKKIFDNFEKSKLYYSRQLWNLLNFELWCRIFMDGDPKKPELDFNKLM
jgi:asparagine synthase (glutamine-hydrolysing)